MAEARRTKMETMCRMSEGGSMMEALISVKKEGGMSVFKVVKVLERIIPPSQL